MALFLRGKVQKLGIFLKYGMYAGRELEELEATMVCVDRPLSLLLPAHRRECSQGERDQV